MPIGIKFFFTIATAVVAVLIYFSGSGKGSARPDWMWKPGKTDPVRNLLFRSEGSARRHMKTCVLILFALALLLLWTLVPTSNIE